MLKMTYGSVHFSVWKNLSDWVQSLPPKGLRKACHAFYEDQKIHEGAQACNRHIENDASAGLF